MHEKPGNTRGGELRDSVTRELRCFGTWRRPGTQGAKDDYMVTVGMAEGTLRYHGASKPVLAQVEPAWEGPIVDVAEDDVRPAMPHGG